DGLLAAAEVGEVGDVATGAVGVVGTDGERLFLLRPVQRLLARRNLDAHTSRRVEVEAAALSDPAAKNAVSRVARFQLLAALMGHSHERLEQDQAFIGLEGIGPPAEDLAPQCQLIEFGKVTAQRQAEATLAGRRAVTVAGVAALFGQRRQNVMDE